MALRALAPVLAVALLLPGAAAAQDTYTMGTSSGGRTSSSSVRSAAEDLARSLGLDCEATDAVAVGRGENGAPQFEIACADGSGYRLVGGSAAGAVDCLALAAQSGPRSRACRLPANQDGTARIARVAREAGLACRVDEGAMIGLTPAGERIYEAGCADAAGAWLEQRAEGWRAVDCLAVAARGQACRFTTEAETLAAFGDQMRAAGSACAPARVRYMGEGPSGPLYETACRSGEGFVVRLGAERRVDEVVPCEAAAHIGGGCTLGETRRD